MIFFSVIGDLGDWQRARDDRRQLNVTQKNKSSETSTGEG
jgi:hypothetical protein